MDCILVSDGKVTVWHLLEFSKLIIIANFVFKFLFLLKNGDQGLETVQITPPAQTANHPDADGCEDEPVSKLFARMDIRQVDFDGR